ncbi:MAG: ATP-binding protein [bacterium]
MKIIDRIADSLSSPTSLDENTFERLFSQLSSKKDSIKNGAIINIAKAEFIDPYGMVGLLEIGWYLKKESDIIPILILPQLTDVLKYLERMDFLEKAGNVFEIDTSTIKIEDRFLRSRHSDVLLEITKIEGTDDIHTIVDRVKQRAETILKTNLNYDTQAIDSFIVALSEICQNIPEHSQSAGYVGIQRYLYEKRLGKYVVKIAVMDLGIGIKDSLTHKYSSRYKDWSDLEAIRLALFEGASRYDDIGRGHGLTNVRKLVQKWGGKFMIRSGTAKLGIVPEWDTTKPQQSALSFFPGTQISIILPEIS